jgi:hypothetical protein
VHAAHPVLFVTQELQEELLLGIRLELQVEGHQVGEGTGVLYSLDELVQGLRRNSPPSAQLGGPLPELPASRAWKVGSAGSLG